MLTVLDPFISETKQTQKQNRKRKRKREQPDSLLLSVADCPSPQSKRCKLSHDDSMNYNYANMNISNIESIENGVSPSPPRSNRLNVHSLSLSGLMTANFDQSPSKNSNKSSQSPSHCSNKSNISNKFASFPFDIDDGDEDNFEMNAEAEQQSKSEREAIDSDDSEYLDQMLAEPEHPKNAKNEAKKIEIENAKENEEKEQKLLEEEGRYSLAIPVIDCERYHFATDRTLEIIATVLAQFMRIHRHPKLRMVVIATDKFHKTLYKKLKNEYDDGNGHENEDLDDVMSLDLECENDGDDEAKYEKFECDERIIIYHGGYADIVRLRDISICCQFLVNFSFWSFDSKKGDKLNKIINKKCIHLKAQSIEKYKTAKKKYCVYPVDVDFVANGQNIRCVLQIRMPSMNKNMQDYVGNAERAYAGLAESYKRILTAFYERTELSKPLMDELVIKDVAKHSRSNKECESLHFSLQKVPKYCSPNTNEWPKFDGFWKDALSVYTDDKTARDAKWQPFIFYEDTDFIVIYDKYCKAKYHLMILPKLEMKSVYDLDPMNDANIRMLEGMLARAHWIKIGLMQRDAAINRIKCGFHAIPSMNQIHLHLLSDDMDSVHLKNKKHFHSFTSPYFVPGKVMLRILKDEKNKFKIDKKYYQQLLKQNLQCHFCSCEIRTMPKLKEHIKRCKFGHRRRGWDAFDDEDEYQAFKVVFE